MSKGLSNASDGFGFVASAVRSEKQQGRFLAQDGRSADGASPSDRNGGGCSGTEDELSLFLAAIEHDNEIQVLQTLKQTEFEVTEKVVCSAGKGASGVPLVRKKLHLGTGLGSAYCTIFEAWGSGRAFRYLPRIYDCYELKDELVVLMEYVQGETMQDAVRRCGASPELAERVFPLVCRAVCELHESFSPPIIHRDLKPSNVILSWDRAALIDFGIARVYNEGSDSDTVRFGTREYAPPEQFGFGQTDVRSDVYSLGMLLFYLLTERAAKAEDRKRGFACSSVPAEFAEVISVACAFDPDARYASASALERAFLQAAEAYRSRLGSDSFMDSGKLATGPGAGSSQVAAQSSISCCGGTANAEVEGVAPTAQGLSTSRCGAAEEEVDATAKLAAQIGEAAPTAASVASQPRKGVSARIFAAANRIPIGVGLAWNVVLGLLWVLVVAACLACCFFPQENVPEYGYPLWVRMAEYLLFLGGSVTCICYELADRRLLRRKFPCLRRWPLWAEFLVVAFGIPLVLAIVMSVCVQLAIV